MIVGRPEKLHFLFTEFWMIESKKEVGYQGDPYLDFDYIDTISVEVSQGEILFYLLEQRLDSPTFMVNLDYCLNWHVKIVGNHGY